MTSIKRYSMVLFLLTCSGVLFFIVHIFDDRRRDKEENERIKANRLRKEYGVPPIEKNWIKENITPTKEKWSDGIRGINTNKPAHLYKEIDVNADKIVSERDAFHFEASDTFQYRLLVTYRYVQNDNSFTRLESKLIVYHPGQFPPSYSRKLSSDRADSVLRAWKLQVE